MKLGKEIVVVSQNKVGTLGAVAAILADRGVNITALRRRLREASC